MLFSLSQYILAAAAAPAPSKYSTVIALSSDQSMMATVRIAGLLLCIMGATYRIIIATSKANIGQQPDYFEIAFDLVINTLFITLVGRGIARFIWDLCHNLGDTIAGNMSYSQMAKLLLAVNEENMKNAAKSISQGTASGVFGAIWRIVKTLVGDWFIWVEMWHFAAVRGLMSLSMVFFETIQVVMFNIVYVFAPLIVGIGSFGETAKMGGKVQVLKSWIDVSAWSITMGVIVLTFKNYIMASIEYMRHAPVGANGAAATNEPNPLIPGQTLIILGCTFAIPAITSTLTGGVGSSLASAGRAATSLVLAGVSKLAGI